jgi:1,4-dihydroxy-2-naphthoate octaprenyltransferase
MLLGRLPLWGGLYWLSLPWALGLLREVWQEEGRPLNLALAGTGRLTLIYGILFSLGLVLVIL